MSCHARSGGLDQNMGRSSTLGVTQVQLEKLRFGTEERQGNEREMFRERKAESVDG